MTRLTTLNLPGFHKQFIGFDNLFDQMDRVFENSPNNGSGGYPPYNIAKLNAGRTFVREFNLAEHVDVKSAKLENGMLNIHLHRDIPEEMKPKKIEINTGPTIEG